MDLDFDAVLALPTAEVTALPLAPTGAAGQPPAARLPCCG